MILISKEDVQKVRSMLKNEDSRDLIVRVVTEALIDTPNIMASDVQQVLENLKRHILDSSTRRKEIDRRDSAE